MNIKIVFLAFFTLPLISQAQKTVLSVGSTPSMLIKTGTLFSADSLVLTPGTDFTLASNVLQETPVAVAFTPSPGIDRAYYLSNQVIFTGTIQLYYQVSELNGNTESALFYDDSTTGGTWLASASSTVNLASHYVQQSAVARPFIAASASSILLPLPLELISFAGAWKGNQAALEWVMEQQGQPLNFEVESSVDGQYWKAIGDVAGLQLNGLSTYDFLDMDPAAHSMYYRIRINSLSGQTQYSYIVRLQKDNDNDGLKLIVHSGSASFYFTGNNPSAARLYNALGQTVWSDNTGRAQYEVHGLTTGIYFLRYTINGHSASKEFMIP